MLPECITFKAVPRLWDFRSARSAYDIDRMPCYSGTWTRCFRHGVWGIFKTLASVQLRHFDLCELHVHHGLRGYLVCEGSTRPASSEIMSSSCLPDFCCLIDGADRRKQPLKPHRYCGERDTRLILPTNSSLSVKLDQDHIRSTTTSRADESFTDGDMLLLDAKEEA
jgi:hypothetical protein